MVDRDKIRDDVELQMKHLKQVEAGLIPEDSPPTFVRPEGDAALVDGKPWWMGPDYHPTEEALKAVEAENTQDSPSKIQPSQTSPKGKQV